MTKRMPLDERLRLHVEIDERTGCWLWQRSVDQGGYGKIGVDGRTMKAHRVSYALFVGDIDEGMMILHSCDTPRCINPDHLSQGTHEENMREKVERGRAPRGEQHVAAKLTADDVAEIKRLRATGEWSQSRLARKFGISPTQVWRIAHGYKWAHT